MINERRCEAALLSQATVPVMVIYGYLLRGFRGNCNLYVVTVPVYAIVLRCREPSVYQAESARHKFCVRRQNVFWFIHFPRQEVGIHT